MVSCEYGAVGLRRFFNVMMNLSDLSFDSQSFFTNLPVMF